MKNTINLIVKDVEKAQRVDQFLSNKEKDLSRTRIKNLILNKKLKINKKTVTDPSKKYFLLLQIYKQVEAYKQFFEIFQAKYLQDNKYIQKGPTET